MNLPKIKSSKKHFLIVSLAIAVILSGIVQQRQLNEIEKEKEDIEQEMKKTQSKNESLMDEIFDKNSQLEKQESDLKKLKKSEETLNKKNKGLKEEIEQKDNKINELNKQVKKLSGKPVKNKQAVAQSNKAVRKTDYYEVTAYHAGYESTGKNPGDKGYGKTASGAYVQEGRTIACPPEIPFGTKINIETVGIRVCEDRGGAIKGKILDLYIEDADRVWQWGRKKLKIEVLS